MGMDKELEYTGGNGTLSFNNILQVWLSNPQLMDYADFDGDWGYSY